MMQLSDDEYDGASVSVDDRGGKIVHDPIHGQITLAPLLLRLLDTPEFQRLRDLKQLGCAYLVFPGASHNRFEHSMGVAHLAECMLTHLRDTQPELGITPRDIELVKVAGLSHDLGHGPFSHCFEEFMHMARPNSEYRHERMSLQMLEVIIKKNSLPFSAEDLQFLRELINPYDNPTQTHPRRFLYDIVANARNSIDVDKFDYLQRDCHNLGMSTSLKHDRLIKHCRVIDNEICFNSKEVYNLYELFHTRYSLHKQVYSHRVSKSIEYMICDVFLLADPVLHIADATEDVAAYAKLTDCVLKEIENSVDPRLDEARKLILRIRTRQLYKLVDETVLPVDAPSVLGEVTVAQLLDCYPPSRSVLSASDLHTQNLRINYAMKDKNPVDSVHFFHKHHRDISFRIPKEKVSHVIPQHFQERILRVFLKDVTEEKMNMAQETVRYFLEQNRCLTPNMMPMRSFSSPPELHVTKPVRGGSNFTKMAAAAAAAAQQQQQQHRQQQRSRIAESAADDGEEDDAEDDIPPSQNTTQTADVEASGGSSQMMDDAAPAGAAKPAANGKHNSAIMERLAAASASSSSAAAASASGVSFALPEATFAPAAAASLQTPTKPQAKSVRRSANAAAAAAGSPERSPPATVVLDRYAPRAEASTPAAAAAASSAASSTPSALGRSTPRGGNNTLGVPTVASASATPHKRRANALTNPTTPAGKLAAQVAASRGNTPATGNRNTPAAAAAGSNATPGQQQSNKRQRVAINTPLAMQPLVPNSSARAASPALEHANGGLPPAPITRTGKKGDNDAAAVPAATAAAAPSGRPARVPSATAKTLQY